MQLKSMKWHTINIFIIWHVLHYGQWSNEISNMSYKVASLNGMLLNIVTDPDNPHNL